jgi:hypothetical protein
MQVSAHKDAVSLFERYAKGGEDPKLRDWAGKTLPALWSARFALWRICTNRSRSSRKWINQALMAFSSAAAKSFDV